MSSTITPALGIINRHDRPEPNAVCVIFGSKKNPKWGYVAPGAGRQEARLLETPEDFTPLSDFGVSCSMTPDAQLALVQMPVVSIATYDDGSPRYWQGPIDAKVEIGESFVGVVVLAVQAEFEARRAKHDAKGQADAMGNAS